MSCFYSWSLSSTPKGSSAPGWIDSPLPVLLTTKVLRGKCLQQFVPRALPGPIHPATLLGYLNQNWNEVQMTAWVEKGEEMLDTWARKLRCTGYAVQEIPVVRSFSGTGMVPCTGDRDGVMNQIPRSKGSGQTGTSSEGGKVEGVLCSRDITFWCNYKNFHFLLEITYKRKDNFLICDKSQFHPRHSILSPDPCPGLIPAQKVRIIPEHMQV